MSDVISGGSGQNGKVSVLGKDGQPLVELLGFDNESVISAGQRGGRPGRLTMYDGRGQQTVSLRAAEATLELGGGVQSGFLTMKGAGGGPSTVFLSAAGSELRLGGGPLHGRISLLGTDRQPIIELLSRPTESVIGLGQRGGRPGRISLYNGNGVEAVRIDAASGVVTFTNADCAEEFDLAEPEVKPSTVMVLTDEGSLAPSEKPYDTRVAGVVSGRDRSAQGSSWTAGTRGPSARPSRLSARYTAGSTRLTPPCGWGTSSPLRNARGTPCALSMRDVRSARFSARRLRRSHPVAT
jgi:hypothetical protein